MSFAVNHGNLEPCSETRPDVKARSSLEQLQVSRNARFSSRESERERGGPFFRWTDVRASVRKFICLVILSHEENILADFYMCYNHTLGSEKSTFIYTNVLHLSWPLK